MFLSCSSDDELSPEQLPGQTEVPEQTEKLTLSVGHVVNTEEIDVEFDILSGNGEYVASVANEDEAKVSIQQNRVKVNLLRNNAGITITDKKNQSVSLRINSSAKSLVPANYSVIIENGDTYTMKNVTFGAGGYTLQKISGTSADARVLENGAINIKSLEPGNSYYKITDKRGTTAVFEVLVTSSFFLESNQLDVKVVNDQKASVWLKLGEGDWRIVESTSSPAIEKVVVIEKGDIDKKFDILSITTSKGSVKGIASIRLQDRAGNYAFVTVHVQ